MTDKYDEKSRELCATGRHYRGPCRLPDCPRCPAIAQALAAAAEQARKEEREAILQITENQHKFAADRAVDDDHTSPSVIDVWRGCRNGCAIIANAIRKRSER